TGLLNHSYAGTATLGRESRLNQGVMGSLPCRLWEKAMPKLTGFGTFAALPEEQLSEKISRRVLSGGEGMVVWWSIGAGVHAEPHSQPNEQIVWVLKGKMEFRLGSEQRVCSQGDVVIIPGGTEHEDWFREDTQVIDFFAPPRVEFLLG